VTLSHDLARVLPPLAPTSERFLKHSKTLHPVNKPRAFSSLPDVWILKLHVNPITYSKQNQILRPQKWQTRYVQTLSCD